MAESDAAGVTDAEMPRLDAVPHDIKLAIVWDEGLAWDDVAALRLTSRSLVEAASTRLFYTVAVSKLHRDRDSFLTICRTPRLARHVCEVEWLELSWDAGFAERVKFPLDSKYSLAEDEDGDDITPANETLFHDIELAAKAAFWLPNHVPGDDATEVACQTAAAAFLPEFQAAVDSLPRLHTFVSRSMPPLRIIIAIGDDNEGYPLSAGTLQAYHATGSPPPPQTNDGFFLFFAPTMARPTSAVTRLRWVDEQPGFSYTRAVPAAALARLTSIDLRFVTCFALKADAFPALEAACAVAAPTVQHLGLSVVDHPGGRGTLHEDDLLLEDYGDGYSDTSWGGDEDEAEDEYRASAPSSTDALGCMVLGRGLGTAPGCALRSLRLVGVRLVVELVDVIRANAGTLRHLHLESVGVTLGLVQYLTKVGGIALETICVVEDYPEYRVNEDKLLGLLNHELPPNAPPTPPLTYDQIRKWPQKLFKVITTATFIDREIRDPDDDDDDGHVRACNRSHLPQHVIEEGDACLDLDLDSDIGVDAAPRWRWAWCVPPGQGKADPEVYCYPVPADEPSVAGDGDHTTEIWRFTDRDGTIGYGRNPLTWFDEWDTAAGDVEEPTPFSHALLSFIERGPNAAEGGNLGRDCLQEPPEGAVAYHRDSDPLINEDLAYDDGD
jgi:hypothetical protein